MLYALADRRLDLPVRMRKAATIGVVAVSVVALAVGAWQAERRIDSHSGFVREKWADLQEVAGRRDRAAAISSTSARNRYDFWRASLVGFEEHPIAGIGGRGFGPWYLQHGRSYETPARAHSLPLDVLLETGLIGFLPSPPPSPRSSSASSGAGTRLGVPRRSAPLPFSRFTPRGDWVWTFPAVGLPVFALVGLALASDDGVAVVGRPPRSSRPRSRCSRCSCSCRPG